MSSSINIITDLPTLPDRPADAHKGTFGSLMIVGGSIDMIGAPMLAARSAYRAGCGLVTVAMPQSVLAAALSTLPEAIGLGFHGDQGDVGLLEDRLEKADAVVAGPGLGTAPAADALLDAILATKKPVVLDADALNLLARRSKWPEHAADLVLTPHPGEMKRLLRHLGAEEVPKDDAGRINLAHAASVAWKAIVVLKGQRTVVADGHHARLNDTGDQTLAKAGSGDVLSGLIGSLLAQGMNPFDAACLGVHFHGKAGERAGRRSATRSALASEVADALAEVMNGQRG